MRNALKCGTFFIMALLIVALLIHIIRNDEHRIPKRIQTAIQRLPKLPSGIKEGQVFQFLGFPKPDEETDSTIEGRTGNTWTRYEIGFGRTFVLECQADNNRSRNAFDFDDGILFSVQIRRLTSPNGSGSAYETLKAWSSADRGQPSANP
jgi:hypothetical protein